MGEPRTSRDGAGDLRAAMDELAMWLPEPLEPLARLAYNYWWSWARGGADVFSTIDAERFRRHRGNPVRFLRETSRTVLRAAAEDGDLVERSRTIADRLDAELAAPAAPDLDGGGPVAFFCAEFGIHPSLPLYSGGLGVLAGDILKEASDRRLPLVGVGLLYRHGYFRQAFDVTGWQREYWPDHDADTWPIALVTDTAGAPLVVQIQALGGPVSLRVWRTDVGRVPLYLLDSDLEENAPLSRWITSRLYDGNRRIRLAQYLALGIGGARALHAMGIEPSLYHLNEGHAAFVALELAARHVSEGCGLDEAMAQAREHVVFTTHTPVPAGNETYGRDEIFAVADSLVSELRASPEQVMDLGRVQRGDPAAPFGMTALALRSSRRANGVSARHGEVARDMWAGLVSDDPAAARIDSVTNGVHLATWMAAPMQDLLDRHLGEGWRARAADPATWEPLEDVPAAELWGVRGQLRARLVEVVRVRSMTERLGRGEDLEDVEAAAATFDADRLTLGFARRLATYKRLHILTLHPEWALRLLSEHGIQIVVAGKAHPLDDGAKAVARELFRLRRELGVGAHAVFLEDYDLTVASTLVAGCDVWLNTPRPPLEASGTSGMKAALNGGLNLSVLDGWWAEAYAPELGWALDGSADSGEPDRDERDAAALFDLIEHQVLPLFTERDEHGVPRAWLARVKASLRAIGPRFGASRMMGDYVSRLYRRP